MKPKENIIVTIAFILLYLLCSGTEIALAIIIVIVALLYMTAEQLLKTYALNIPSDVRKIISVLIATVFCVTAMVLYNLG